MKELKETDKERFIEGRDRKRNGVGGKRESRDLLVEVKEAGRAEQRRSGAA